MFPERQFQNGLPVWLEILYRFSQNNVVQKWYKSEQKLYKTGVWKDFSKKNFSKTTF